MDDSGDQLSADRRDINVQFDVDSTDGVRVACNPDPLAGHKARTDGCKVQRHDTIAIRDRSKDGVRIPCNSDPLSGSALQQKFTGSLDDEPGKVQRQDTIVVGINDSSDTKSSCVDVALWVLLSLFLIVFVMGSGFLIWTVYETLSQRRSYQQRKKEQHDAHSIKPRKILKPPLDVLLRMRLRDNE